MGQARFYLGQSDDDPHSLKSPSEVAEYAREFRRRKGLPEEPPGEGFGAAPGS